MSALIIVNGEEEFLKERAARDEATASLAPAVLTYRLPDLLHEYEEEASMIPMDGSARAFILLDAKSVPILPAGDGDVVIVVSEGPKLADHRAKRILDFPKLKAFDDNNEVIKWILREGEASGVNLDRVAGALFVNVGTGLRKLRSEISKIVAITPPGGTASPEDVRSVLCFAVELTPKQIVDALCEGNVPRALAFYDKLQDGGDETGWILAYMQRHVLQQIRLAEIQALGLPHADAAARMGVHPFIYRKMLESRAGLWPRPSLLSSLATLCDLDLANRRGSPHVRFCLEMEIVRLAEESHGNQRGRNG